MQGALGSFSERIAAPASLGARLVIPPWGTPHCCSVSPQKAQATVLHGRDSHSVLQRPWDQLCHGSQDQLSLASQTAPSLCGNACLLLATNYWIVQNRQARGPFKKLCFRREGYLMQHQCWLLSTVYQTTTGL